MNIETSSNILVVDTAMQGCGVGVYCASQNAIITERLETLRGQAEHLVPMISSALSKAGLTYNDLDFIVTTLGPGSFTGLRIGMSAAKSYALALNIPIYGISTLQALALQYAAVNKNKNEIGVLIETKRSDFYFQHFDAQGQEVSAAIAIEKEELLALLKNDKEINLIGDAVLRFHGQDEIGCHDIDCGFLAEIFSPDHPCFTSMIEPIYLRGADVSAPKTKKRVLGD